MGFLPEGLESEFETAVLNEPSVFEPLRFYCICNIVIHLYFMQNNLYFPLPLAVVQGKLPVPGRPTCTIRITVGIVPTALAVGAGGGCLDNFTLIYPFSPLSPCLWETVRYRLKYCLKGPLSLKQPTNQLHAKQTVCFHYQSYR